MIKSILFCLIFLVLISKPTYSQTYITNDIISQTNWVISGSPYILNNSISILSNLYIDSNVVVNMNGFSMHVGSDWNNGNLSCNGVEFNSPSESQIYIYGWYSDVGSFGNCIFDKVCVGSGSYQLYLIDNTFKNLIDNYPITLNPSGGAYNTSITGNNFVNCSKIGIGVGFGVVRTNFWLKNFDNLEYFLTGSGEILGGYDGVGG
ncbi:MAG: hypothetical protein Q8M94_10475, partial [Ignavibacteria bacterium]|nr:hypothetical protein [Ignavibacteria bacterium]